MSQIAIIGGGAAGLMAAAVLGEHSEHRVTLFEGSGRFGRKLRITGKGRCNVTNAAPVAKMPEMIPRGGKFLLTALYSFPPEEVCRFFEERGVPLKTERGGRIFPVSDQAGDVVDCLVRAALKSNRVKKCLQRVRALEKTEEGFLIHTEEKALLFDRVLLATGGLSYPRTGSTGDGYAFARALGHHVEPPRPALCPLVTSESLPREAMGLSLKNCAIRVETLGGKRVYEDFGELLFTHFGLSGPVILSASSYLDFTAEKSYRLILDLKPALTREMLDQRILRDFKEWNQRDLIRVAAGLLPQKLLSPLLRRAGLEEHKKVSSLTREERLRLVDTVKALSFTLTGHRPIEEAIVTRGGVSLKEINPRTMESKLIPGLYFAGEVMDADALTGGFNLQIALSTGHLAGESLSREEL